jgi:hypothetical protein
MYIHIVSQCAIKRVYTTLNSCNVVLHMTDMYLTIQIQHNTVEYLTLKFHPEGDSIALKLQENAIIGVPWLDVAQ